MVNGRGLIRPPGMNRLEAAYADHLEQRRVAGDIIAWDFEPERLVLANRCTYTPDFRLLAPDGGVSFPRDQGLFARGFLAQVEIRRSVPPLSFLSRHGEPQAGWRRLGTFARSLHVASDPGEDGV